MEGDKTQTEEEWIREMWAFAIYDLNMSEKDFWDLTPWDLDALIERHMIKMQLQDFYHARLAYLVHNAFYKKRLAFDKFRLFKPERKPQTVEEQIKIVEMITLALGGEDRRKA